MIKPRKVLNFLILWLIVLLCLTCMALVLDLIIAGRFPGPETPFDPEFGLLLGALAVPTAIQIGRGMGLLGDK